MDKKEMLASVSTYAVNRRQVNRGLAGAGLAAALALFGCGKKDEQQQAQTPAQAPAQPTQTAMACEARIKASSITGRSALRNRLSTNSEASIAPRSPMPMRSRA